MTRSEVRDKLLKRKVVPFEHGGAKYELRLPRLDQMELAGVVAQKSQRALNAYLVQDCLLFDGVPVFESADEISRMAADEAPLIDAAAKAIMDAMVPSKPPAAASPEEAPKQR